MCDAYTPAGEPIPTNKRHAAAKVFSHPDVVAEVPWYLFVADCNNIINKLITLLPLVYFVLIKNCCMICD